MGQAFSTSNNVFIHLEKQVYFAGEVIRGSVCLNCKEPFEGTRLHLKILGTEHTEWTETHSDSEKTHNNCTTRLGQTLDIYKVDVTLPLPSSTLKPGQYQFPFETILPVGVPGSFEINLGHGRGAISYKVEAHCHVPGFFTRDLKHTIPLIVRQKFLRPVNEQVVHESKDVNTCCCCYNGYVSLQVRCQKDAYVAGELVQLMAEVNNSSSTTFEEALITLVWELQLRGEGRATQQTRQLGRWKYSGVPAGALNVRTMYNIPLPTNLHVSTQSSLISSTYFVEVKLAAGLLTTRVRLQLPVVIYEPQPATPVWAAPSAPDFWAPEVVMPTYNFEMPSAPPLAPPPMAPMSKGGSYPPASAMGWPTLTPYAASGPPGPSGSGATGPYAPLPGQPAVAGQPVGPGQQPMYVAPRVSDVMPSAPPPVKRV